MNSRRLSAASGWMSSKSAVPSTSNPSPDATTTGSAATIAIGFRPLSARRRADASRGLSRVGQSAGQDVVDDDRRLLGDRDQVVVITGEQASAYGTVAEHDPPTRSTQVEPLTRDDDPGQRSPVGVDDLGPE